MKVLFVGHRNPDFPTVTEFFERAFQKLGHEVCFIEYRDYILPGRVVRYNLLAQRIEATRLGKRFVNTASDFAPDLIFVNYGEWLPMAAVQKVKQQTGALSVVWFADFPGNTTYRHRVLEIAHVYDLVAVQGRDMAVVIQQKAGIEAFWLPAAADPSVHYPSKASKKEGVCFVGSWYPRRENLLREICDYPLTIAGPGWGQAARMGACSIHIGGQGPDVTRRIYSTSAISLSIHLLEPWENVSFTQASPRVFEILACGGFLLSDRTKDLNELLTEGMHYIGFDSAAELREQITYYLIHSSERQKIAHNGFDCVLRHHTYEHRLRSLLAKVDNRI